MHRTTKRFWKCFYELPDAVQATARESFQLLQAHLRHPTVQFKKVGKFWPARVDAEHRALAVEDEEGFVWAWIGRHDEYERLIQR
jgi:hypothetical protein